MYGAGDESSCIKSQRDPRSHGHMKKSLSGALSTKALAEQEHIIQHCFEDISRAIPFKRTTKALDRLDWFEMIWHWRSRFTPLKTIRRVLNGLIW